MIVKYTRLICFFYVLVVPSIALANPPQLLLCQTEIACDRNVKDFEHFVVGFYQWYLSTSGASQETTLQTYLTPDFWAWRRKISAGSEVAEVFDHRYCPSDTDPLLCAQDFYDEWAEQVSVQLIAMDQNVAVLLVKLPSPPDEAGLPQAPHLLSLRLKPMAGAWLIDGVIDMLGE